MQHQQQIQKMYKRFEMLSKMQRHCKRLNDSHDYWNLEAFPTISMPMKMAMATAMVENDTLFSLFNWKLIDVEFCSFRCGTRWTRHGDVEIQLVKQKKDIQFYRDKQHKSSGLCLIISVVLHFLKKSMISFP